MFALNVLVHVSCLVTGIAAVDTAPTLLSSWIHSFYHLVLDYHIKLWISQSISYTLSRTSSAMSFPMGCKSFLAVKSKGTEITGQCDSKVFPFNMPVQMWSFLITVATVGTLPHFVSTSILKLNHLALNVPIVSWKEKFRNLNELSYYAAVIYNGS